MSSPRASRRIVLTCWGSYGDLFPYLAIAIRLKAMGHVPVMATCAYYRPIVESAGIEFHPMRPDIDPADSALLRRVMDPAKGSETIVREVTAPAVRMAFEDVLPIARDADLLVGHPIAFATPLVAGVLGVPWMSVVLAPTSLFSVYDYPLLPPYPALMHVPRAHPLLARVVIQVARTISASWVKPVRELRRERGLPDAGHPLFDGQYSPYGTLALYSRVLGAPQPDWPAHTVQTGFVFHEDDRPLPDALAEFIAIGDPPIVFTLGSSAVGAPGRFYHQSIDAAVRLRHRAVLLVGPNSGLTQQSMPAGICLADYAPHAALFRHAAAVVHHGGVGTLGQALRAGCPMLVVPHAHDQPDNAYRATQLGVARTLDARRYNATRAAGDLAALVGDPAYRAAGSRVRQAIADEDGTFTACQVLIEKAGAGRDARSATVLDARLVTGYR